MEANIPLDRWFFVHGMWALNGSDADVCTITDEMQRLQRLGCLGDFSFPAGRPHCDPRYTEPVFVRPVEGLKAYDMPEADAVPAYGNPAAAAAGKFFIWSSAIKATASSIDYYSPEVRRRCEDVGGWAEEIIDKSVLKDGTLFVKTHAHSMYSEYFEAARRPIPPHLYPGVQNLLCALFDGAADAGIMVEFATASEVYRRFTEAAEAATVDRPDAPEATTSPVLAALPEAPADIEGAVNRAALAVMERRLASLGSTGAGTYPYYDALIKQGRLLQQYELRVAGYLFKHLPPGQPIVEVGCGLGILVLSLAAAGRQAVGIEGDRRRLDSFVAIREALAETLPHAKANSRAVAGLFPGDPPLDLPREAVLVFTNTVCGIDLDTQRAIVRAAAEFASVLFDAQRFFIKRTTPAEIAELLELFGAAGFADPVKVIDLGESGEYYYAAGRAGSAAAIGGER